MKHHQFAALVAAVDGGGFHAAARSLNLTQPAITRAIKDLEAELGVQLFVRQARGVTLTTEGALLLPRARLVVSEMRRAREDIARVKDRRGGSVVIGVTPLAGLTILPKAFERFRAAWPDVALQFIEFTSEQFNERLRDGTLDFAVGGAAKQKEGAPLHWEELFSLPSSLAVHRGSPLSDCRTLAELQGAEWIHGDITGRFPTLLTDLFSREGLPPPQRVTRCTSQALLHSLAMQNNVVLLWSLLAIGMPELRTRFVALPVAKELPRMSVSLLVRRDSPPSLAADYFIRCIRAVAAEDWALLEQPDH